MGFTSTPAPGAGGGGGSVTFEQETITLDGTDITNQYVDLANEVKADSLILHAREQLKGTVGIEYTLSTVAGPVTRITFAGAWATGGLSALVATDVLDATYVIA